MTTHSELLKRARKMGHEITPQLNADLKKLAGVSDSQIEEARQEIIVQKMAAAFKVPVPVMERRLVKRGDTP